MRAFSILPALAAILALASPAGAQPPPTVPDIVGAVASGETSAASVVAAALSRAQEIADLNAMITVDADGARAAAEAVDEAVASGGAVGPLAGLPLVVKDNIAAAGLPLTAGTPALRDVVPADSAPVLERLLEAGAILVGKTNMHELAFGITSNNAAFGAVGNAVAPDRFAGGSSGGTGAAIAAGVAPAGLGTDTGGSVRIPAALNGIVGFRPSTGRYPQAGIVPISTTRDTAGPMARTVAGVALLDAVMAGTETVTAPADLSAVRLGVAAPMTDDLSPGVAASFAAALDRLQAAGVTLVEVDVSGILALNQEASFPIALFEARRDLARFLRDEGTGLTVEDVAAAIASPDVRGVYASAVLGPDAIPETVYRRAVDEVLPRMRSAYAALMEENGLDALVFPTTPLPAQPIEGSDETVMLNGAAVPTFPTFIRNTDVGSLLAVPGLSLPMTPTDEGLPVGLELDGRSGQDEALLSLGLAVEGVLQR